MKLKWASSSKSSWFALQILELLEDEWKLCCALCMTGCSSPNNSSFTHSKFMLASLLLCFCLDIFYGYRFRIWIYVLPWDMYVFQRMLVPPLVSGGHFTDISGRCRAASTVGSHFGWRLSGLSTRKMLQSVLPASFISSCEGQSSRIFFMQKCPFVLCLARSKLPLQSLLLLRQWVLLLCAWGCSFYTLLFLAIGKGENE